MRATILPSNWCEATFEDVLADISNGISDSQNKEAEGIPVSRIETIATGKVNLAKVGYVSSISEDSAERYLLKPGDILFSHINSPAHIGKTAIFTSGRLYHGTNVLRIRTQRDICTPEYFEYYCRYFRSTGEFSMNAQHAVNQSSLNQKKIKAFTLPLPPLAEQTRIAQKLDELLAQVDTLKARIDAIPALLKRFRQSVLAAAVSGRLTEEWRHHLGIPNPTDGKLSDCIETMIGGASPKTTDYSATGMLALNKGDIKEYGRVEIKQKPKYVPLEFVEINSKKVIPDRTVLVTLRDLSQKADFLGLFGRYRGEQPALITQGMYGLKVNPRVAIEDYLIAFSNSPQYRTQVKREKVGATQVHLRNGQFLDFAVPIFVIEEQTEIVRRVEQLFAFADQLESKVQRAKSRIDHLTQSILAKAFRGELVPQDPNDEPANVLLERIKAQRIAAPKTKRGRKSA